ncbi:seryl-tRNA synthetase [Syntrophotalea carbinolica DSM 2380]|uniref:Serine--tRNA ligase n=1 Tax=Syntrophotalea carbinolica (strain DSM 2380 / NBRC 103641 / GraBd1) TaxID=338963 RepID=SYS_SYNC1|nr:serine--tRNA ligase [Syntrophotalea carbinolica]Q3A7Q8.1 RecName: Full=Serine--tRNA ligase; AltName: Full=Seryl-tRNA synthetase; Short=SerRS; AltName: Full=Seryl-tRNA(Ser/Sec) synthetase [Syntrophotalea carbinolica DSM 2380]ABA87586.1 seryl-tRNA synthetase [Syntrophotalea carbinolica DSM 2380]
MLDLKFVRDHFAEAEQRLATRGGAVDLSAFTDLDARRRTLLGESESLKAEKNQVSALIGKTKDKSQVQGEIARMKDVSVRIKELDEELKQVEGDLRTLLMTLPNLPHEDCPVGTSEDDNKEVRRWGQVPEFDFEAQSHWDIGERLDILDFERAGKLAGARFAIYKGAGARLERALINFMLDLHTGEHKYVEILPPLMVNRDTMTGTGQLPKFESDLFHLDDPDFFLIPTAEVPVTNIHRDEILADGDLPVCYAAYTPCFRKEAGSHGRDTRGLIRMHQFNKVELVKFARPEESDQELLKLLDNAEEVLRRLKLPYRVVDLCTGDIGFSAARTFDIEVWLPGQQTFREISSCSNFRDFQARRAAIRFRREEKGKPELVHTLNGSGLAVGRTLVAILENYQQEDGSVVIPEALRPYMGGVEKISA